MKPLKERMTHMAEALGSSGYGAALLIEAKAYIEALEESNAPPAQPDGTNRYFIMEETVYGPHRHARNCWKLYDKMMVSKFGTTRRPLAYFYSQDIATHTCMMMNGTSMNSNEHVLRERLGKAIHDAAKLATARDEYKAAYEEAKAQAHIDREATEKMNHAYNIQARELQAISDAAKSRSVDTLSAHMAYLERTMAMLGTTAGTYKGDTAKGWHDRAAAVQNYMDAAGAKLIAIRKVLES